MAPNTENLKEDIETVGKRSKHDEEKEEEKKTNETPMEQSMTQESFLGYFNLIRKGTEHQSNSTVGEKKTRKSGRLSNPYYDTTQFYETIYDKKTSAPEDKKKLQCPSCENKYSRKDYLENHIRKAHEEKDLNSDSNSSFDTESNEKEVTAKKSNEKTCIPCEKTFFTSYALGGSQGVPEI